MCNPEFSQSLRINDKLKEKLEVNNLRKDLIKAYQIWMEIPESDRLFIQGVSNDVNEVKLIIDLELNKIKNLNNSLQNADVLMIDEREINEHITPKPNAAITSSILNDDDIIWISDPYELFDTESKKENTKLRKSDEINHSFKKMSFRNTEPTTTNQETVKSASASTASSSKSVSTKPSSSSSSSHITSSPDTKHEKLFNMAILHGFDREEIEQGLAEFTRDNAASADILDYAFIEYLKMSKKFNYSQQANIEKNVNSLLSGKKKKKKPALKVPMQTNSTTPSLQAVEPASKKLNVEANLNDSDECLYIDYVPSANANSSVAMPSTSSSAQATKAKSSEKVLSEYAKMVQGQEFNQENEKLDKPMRLSKLISAMPDNQKLTALHHVNTYRTANSNTNTNTNSNNINNTNNNNNGATFSNEKSNGNNPRTANFNYDPTVYQDNHIDSFNILFTNFSDSRKNTDLRQNNQQQQQQQNQNQKPFEVNKAAFKPPIFSNLNNENLQNRILKTDNMSNNNNSRRSRFNRRKNNHTSVERNSQFKSRSKSKNQRFASCDKPLSGINNGNFNFNQINNRNNNNNNNLKNGQKFNAVPFPFEHVKSTIKVSEYELIIFLNLP
jgi:ribosomal protein L34E